LTAYGDGGLFGAVAAPAATRFGRRRSMSDTGKADSTEPDEKKTRTEELPDGLSSDGSDDTDRDTASVGPA
jgi:hypothetical protein